MKSVRVAFHSMGVFTSIISTGRNVPITGCEQMNPTFEYTQVFNVLHVGESKTRRKSREGETKMEGEQLSGGVMYICDHMHMRCALHQRFT
jgi:hypothetical protein